MRWTRPPSWSIRIGASARPTVSRSESQSARTCSGFSTLRLNRMKPHGAASRKNADLVGGELGAGAAGDKGAGRSCPRLKAPRTEGQDDAAVQADPRSSVLRHEALTALPLELGAERGGLVARHRADADAVDGVAVHLGLADQRREPFQLGELRWNRLKVAWRRSSTRSRRAGPRSRRAASPRRAASRRRLG